MSSTGVEVRLRSDARRTRDRLLDAAADLLEIGGQHFTLPDLARQAGVGTATVYRHFADLAELLAAVEIRAITALTTAVDAVPADQGARLRFGRICAIWVDRASRESAAVRFLRSPEGVLQRAGRGDPSISALVTSLAAVVNALIQESQLPPQDPTAAVLIWITLFDERTVFDLERTLGWRIADITGYLSDAVLGALTRAGATGPSGR